jgi:hypothetical protein
MLRKGIPVLFAIVLAGSTASAKDDETYLGLKLITSPWGNVEYKGEERQPENDLRFGYGFGVWLENSLFSFLAIGGTVEYRRFAIDDHDDQGSAMHISPLVRIYFPGNRLEPYLKGQLGLTLMWPPDEPVETDFGPGFNWEAILGLAIRWERIGIFAELGIGQTTGASYWHGEGTDTEVTFDISHLDANAGLLFIF